MLRVLGRLAILAPAIAFSLAVLGAPPGAEAADLEKGKATYTLYCVTCHGEKGDGKGIAGVALDPAPRDFSKAVFVFDTDKDGQMGTDADLAAVIKSGAAVFGGSPLMTPWAHLQPGEVQDLIGYIRSLGESAASVAETGAEKSTP